MRANSTYGIKRDLERFCAIVRAARDAGKIDEATADRQFDAVASVEMAMPITAYDRWEWTDESRNALAKIRAFLAKRRAA